jgi:hypothetical protein
MAETTPGGRYISEDGKTIHDANGKVIKVIAKEIEPEPVKDAPAEYAKELQSLEVQETPPAPMVSPRTGETATTPHRLTKFKQSKKAK